MRPRSILSPLQIVVATLAGLGLSGAAAPRWMAAPAPPDMIGERGNWWIDQASIARRGDLSIFVYLRGATPGQPPALVASDEGLTAIRCRTGESFVKGVCTGGGCSADRPFPQGWTSGRRFSPDDRVYKAVCR